MLFVILTVISVFASISQAEQFELKLWPKFSSNLPCFSSLTSQPKIKENCRPWLRNIEAAVTIDESRAFLLSGADDNFLYVIDMFTGIAIAKIPSPGNIVTRTKFNQDKNLIYFGTEKGYLISLDAFSFSKKFDFLANSKINNNIQIFKNDIIFSTILGTIYSINSASGKMNWLIERPVNSNRIKISSNSNLIILPDQFDKNKSVLIAPNADGHLDIIDPDEGIIKTKINLPSVKKSPDYPDIVAPMVIFGDNLWVASHDLGLYNIKINDWYISGQFDYTGILQMAKHSNKLYAASSDNLYCFSKEGIKLWETSLANYKTSSVKYVFPFDRNIQPGPRLFMGRPSDLVFLENSLIMFTDLGAGGVFNTNTGELKQAFGGGVGFSPNVAKVSDDKLFVVSSGGRLYQLEKRKNNSINKWQIWKRKNNLGLLQP